MVAQRQGIPVSQLSRRLQGRQIQHDPGAEASLRSLLLVGASGNNENPTNDGDEEGAEPGLRHRGTWLSLSKIAECRERSQSAWLHFPHVELVFLLFAFEGAVASQVSAIRENDSPVVFTLAVVFLVSLCIYSSPHAICSRSAATHRRRGRARVMQLPRLHQGMV